MPDDDVIVLRARRFLKLLRHCQVLGMQVEHADSQGLTLRLPYSDLIIGNPETGSIHGGALTTLLDTTCGIATTCVLPTLELCPTLDLRIDHMHAAEPGLDLLAFAECYRVTPQVIFARGIVYQRDRKQPLAHAVGTFMRMGEATAGLKDWIASEEGGV